MAEGQIQRFLKAGRLKRQTAGVVQVESLVSQALLDLSEAKKVLPVAERAAYLMAYMAMLKAGRALLLLRGYVPDDGAQHKTVVEVTGELLGEEFKGLVAHFEIMRRKRNDMTYEAGALLSSSESRDAFEDAVGLVRAVLAEVKKTNPQIELRLQF